MVLLKRYLKSEKKEMLDNNIRLTAIGQIERLPEDVQEVLAESMAITKKNDGMLLNLALSYGGRAEIVRVVQEIAKETREGKVDPDSITSELITEHLYTRGMRDPDLLIRTSGEMRISNFLLWQIAYSEIYVTDTLWPDFSKDEYIRILKDFQRRERRFGKVE
jgi:undecaprenyl diphosphate synthase